MQGDAWWLATEAADAAGVGLRPLDTLEEADLATGVMIATWGEHQLLPRELLRAFQDSGNAPWGAYHGNSMVGYVLGFLGWDEGLLHVHSHMLAVLPEWRSKGVGYALKLAQRAAALEAGVHLARWTYDPMLRGNANFNLSKLGVVGDRFQRNFYGEMSDTLNRGERSDRLVVRWDLDRVPGPRSHPPGDASVVLRAEGPREAPRPALAEEPLLGAGVVAAIAYFPPHYQALRAEHLRLAAEWRDALADALERCFSAGMIVTGFDPRACAYRLARPAELADDPSR